MIDFFGGLVHALGLDGKYPFSCTVLPPVFKKLGLDQGPTKRREEEGGNSRGEVPEGWGMHAGETGKWWSEGGMVLGPGTCKV